VRLNNKIAAMLMPVILFIAGCSTYSVNQEKSALPVARQDKQPIEAGPDPVELAKRDYERALDALGTGHDNNAKQQFLALIEAYPEFSGPYANLGILYLREGDLKAAEDNLTKAVQVNPDNAMAYNQLGILYRRIGRFDEAKRAYDHALRITPDYANAHLNLGILYDLFLQNSRQALRHYERYLELKPGDGDQVSLWLADLKQRIANNNISTNEAR